jgi:hypothetical protein
MLNVRSLGFDAWFAIGFSRLTVGSSEWQQHPALLERKDGTLAAWYRWLYAPRTGEASACPGRPTTLATMLA